MRALALILAALTLTGCAQQFAGATYRTSVGRQVTEFWQRDAVTTWNAGVEFRFDAKRCGGCHAVLSKDQGQMPI